MLEHTQCVAAKLGNTGAQHGFTLLEVLISIVILSIGLLGLAGLQTTSLQANQSALHTSQANQLAYDIVDRMRANRDAARENAYDIGIGDALPSNLTQPGRDIRRWNEQLGQRLPQIEGSQNNTVSLGAITVGNDDVVLVTLQWLDRRPPQDSEDTQGQLRQITLSSQL